MSSPIRELRHLVLRHQHHARQEDSLQRHDQIEQAERTYRPAQAV
jgi:hypothetical protein